MTIHEDHKHLDENDERQECPIEPAETVDNAAQETILDSSDSMDELELLQEEL